jgi:hypothetical protein
MQSKKMSDRSDMVENFLCVGLFLFFGQTSKSASARSKKIYLPRFVFRLGSKIFLCPTSFSIQTVNIFIINCHLYMAANFAPCARSENRLDTLSEDTGLTVEQIQKYYDDRHNSPEDFIRYLCYACSCHNRQRDKDRSRPEFVAHVIELFHK